MKPTKEILQAAFVSALWYYMGDRLRKSSVKIRDGDKFKIKDRDNLLCDVFAGIYFNLFRFPPSQYEDWFAEFFETVV